MGQINILIIYTKKKATKNQNHTTQIATQKVVNNN